MRERASSMASALPSFCGIRRRTRLVASSEIASSMRSRRVLKPMPFAADTCTVCGSSRKLSRCLGGRRSILFFTTSSGLLANSAHIFNLLMEMANSAMDLATVGFELSFAWATGPDAAAELRHFRAAPGEARQHVFELRQFHLQLAFAGAGMGGENVEDQLGSVDHAHINNFFDIALL